MRLLTREAQWQGGETVVALGMFDGVHLGHAALIRKANALAALHDLHSVVLTYDAHPLAVIHPERVPCALTTREEKVSAIAHLRPDALVMRPFDAPYAALPPEAFVRALCSTLRVRHMVIGFNYSFGAKGAGNPETLLALGGKYGFTTHVVGAVEVDGLPVSSTRIREALSRGDMALCEKLLGRPYSIGGQIVQGKQLGRKLGFPTANLHFPRRKALPPFGVYAAFAWIEKQRYPAVINIGQHPTAPEGQGTIEAHLIDAKEDLYGKSMHLDIKQFLRTEQKFASLDALKAQIAKDTARAKEFLDKK